MPKKRDIKDDITEILSTFPEVVVFVNSNGTLNVCCPPAFKVAADFGSHIEILGIEEYRPNLHSGLGFDSKKPFYSYNEETGVYNINSEGYKYLSQKLDIDLPGKGLTQEELAYKNTSFGINLEWNAKHKKIDISNSFKAIFRHQLNNRALCISSDFDNLSCFHDMLKDIGLKENKDFVYQDESENHLKPSFYFKPKAIEKLIESGRVDFGKLPNFEGKHALVRNISSKMTITESRNWAERVLSRFNSALSDETISLNGELGFSEKPSRKTNESKSYKIRHWPIFDRNYHDPERF